MGHGKGRGYAESVSEGRAMTTEAEGCKIEWPPENIRIRDLPKPSDWECRLLNDTVYRPNKGSEPCWFHRKMQELCFGFRWVKVGG